MVVGYYLKMLTLQFTTYIRTVIYFPIREHLYPSPLDMSCMRHILVLLIFAINKSIEKVKNALKNLTCYGYINVMDSNENFIKSECLIMIKYLKSLSLFV